MSRRASGNGGAPARRAVLRWAWRLFRGEWRQQILVLALLTVAVAAATFSAAFAYNVTPGPGAEFGSADQFLRFDGSDAAATAVDVGAARKYFGTIDVITTRSVRIPGSVERLEFRAEDPHGAYTAPMLALRHGRYPTGGDEVALTDAVARTFKVGVGASLGLEGRSLTVVGLVENPSDLNDEFALLSPSSAGVAETVTILVRGSRDGVDAFRRTMTVEGNVIRGFSGQGNEKAAAAMMTFGLATVGLLLVALIAAAGFVVLAQRRLRQLGMLAAVGATEKHVRLVTVLNGTLVGVVAAVIGTATGLAVWVAALGRVEEAAAHRIGALSVPWWLIATSMVLAVVTATAAAWWPARTVARLPVMLALSTRPPKPKPLHRSALFAGALILIGLACFRLADQKNALLIIAGTLATMLGTLMIAPLAIGAAAAGASRLPIAGRLALRDLGRYRARSGAALAAISLALGLPVAVVVVASAAEYTAAEGNLSNRQLLIRVGDTAGPAMVIPERTPTEVEALRAQVDRFAATLDSAAVMPLDMAVDPAMPPEPGLVQAGERQAVELARQSGPHQFEGGFPGADLYVGTPELLGRYGIDPGAIDSHDLWSVQTGTLLFSADLAKRNQGPLASVANVAHIGSSGYSSAPGSFLSPAALRSRGWERVRAGWFIETASPLTGAQRAAARDMAVAAGLTIEARNDQASLSNLRTGATAAGMLLALGVLAMTVGLIRSEAAGDLRTLVATGASSTIRRTLTATTAGALAMLGVLLGTAGAYLVLIGAYLGHLGDLSQVPVLHLAVTALGVPLVAAGAGWLLAGREPPAIARPVLE